MAYPLNLDITHQEKNSRFWALSTLVTGMAFIAIPGLIIMYISPATSGTGGNPTFLVIAAILLALSAKGIALIPHFIIIWILNYVFLLVGVLGVIATLLTGKFPKPLEKFMIGYWRWSWKLTAYFFCLTDKYPDFTFSESEHPAKLTLLHEEKNSRLWALATILFPIKLIATIPHIIAIIVLGIVASMAIFLGPLVTLAVGRYPKSFQNLIVGYMRWVQRLAAFIFCMTSKYPPFSMEA
jgi:hypothetical protein